MEFVFVVAIVVFFTVIGIWLEKKMPQSPSWDEKKNEGESETASSPSTPKHKSDNEPNRDGIPELIRQQEQTNIHLQKLINDFFWFRIAIILLFVSGGVGAVVTWT